MSKKKRPAKKKTRKRKVKAKPLQLALSERLHAALADRARAERMTKAAIALKLLSEALLQLPLPFPSTPQAPNPAERVLESN